MPRVPLVALVGMPGSGKSTVGRQLARQLHRAFVDSDAVIEQRSGGSVRAYFALHGEAAFRDLEAEVISYLCDDADRPAVLATGGGAVLRPSNRDALRRSGAVVYLHSSPEELYRRLRHDRSRPLLQVADPLAQLREIFSQRDPLYRQAADFVIETGRPSVATLANMIAMQLELTGALSPAWLSNRQV